MNQVRSLGQSVVIFEHINRSFLLTYIYTYSNRSRSDRKLSRTSASYDAIERQSPIDPSVFCVIYGHYYCCYAVAMKLS